MTIDSIESDRNLVMRSRSSRALRGRAGAWGHVAAMIAMAILWAGNYGWAASPTAKPKAPAARSATGEIVVYASELPKQGLSEFSVWKDPASPGGVLVGTPNSGDELDPPPENDPHVTFKVKVQSGVAYRPWMHMKVGAAKGKSQANLVFVQFSGAVDAKKQPTLEPKGESYLSLRGPARPGWAWVSVSDSDPKTVTFASSGEITVRLQAGMEGVGFDQFVLSPARYKDAPPSEAVVKK
jgi:hypothetical protein